MKKVLSLALALLLMIGALSVTVSATGSSEDHDIIVNIGNGANHVYSADITFAPGVFKYETESVWDSDLHLYLPGVDGAWNNTMGSVTVTNHSDIKVNYTVSITGVVDSYGDTLDIVFDGEDPATKTVTGQIDPVAIGAGAGVEKLLAKWDVTGTPTRSEISAQKLGTITVTLEGVFPTP